MNISVILSTYNKPHDLERSLWGYAVQTTPAFEIVVADDGSTSETLDMIRKVEAESGMRVRHVWHEDRGFRKTEILNRAIAASHGDYLLFSDGDCIPRSDFISTHASLAEPGRYLAGGYLKLPENVSRAISVDDVRNGRFSELAWLRTMGWKPGRRALRLTGSRRIGALFDALTPTTAYFAGNNASVWRDALLEVNGFEHEMGYGSEDKAVGIRLENMGVKGKKIRHRAVCFHMHHGRPYRDAAVVQKNVEILKRLRRTGEHRAREGVAELSPDPSVRVDGLPISGSFVSGGEGP